ncbi:hypothetical protein GGTG_09899 [Gaeumannomyces tritici R3-111a-1]|uniref:Uncharacterized protein n=1 Tax=Gaeumannomyces tritici (strain R3-111a-1) TaxID=644352 RepID=J3P8R4_GAET3|nr:hypothetical protein GGTG_09899 [Gaeumannomyces tritici R3-111a-1]EJT73048.1 hypothetical protein GGTG_09899 [Gaeumannomyces tritici R3-111a-1]
MRDPNLHMEAIGGSVSQHRPAWQPGAGSLGYHITYGAIRRTSLCSSAGRVQTNSTAPQQRSAEIAAEVTARYGPFTCRPRDFHHITHHTRSRVFTKGKGASQGNP